MSVCLIKLLFTQRPCPVQSGDIVLRKMPAIFISFYIQHVVNGKQMACLFLLTEP